MDASREPRAPSFKVLVVEDDPEVADHLEALVRGWGYDARVSSDGRAARATTREWNPDLALVDLGLPNVNGLDLLRELRAREVEAVVMSGRASVSVAVETVASGASVFLEKPVSAVTLRSVLADAERRSSAAILPTSAGGVQTLVNMLSASPSMHEMFDLVRCVAPTDANVLI